LAPVRLCRGDDVVLLDGRILSGIVRIEGDSVLIQMPNATLKFPRDQVQRIDQHATPEEEFAAKLADASQTDPQALFSLVQWASTNGLDKQAQDLAGKIIQISPDHAGAHKMLGQLKLDNQWQPFAKAMEIARGKLEAGHGDVLIKDVLPALEAIATTKDKQQAVRELQAQALLRTREFSLAAKTFAATAELSDPATAMRMTTLADIIKENPDGMYVLTETYPPSAGILGEDKTSLKPGPASLADPLVAQAALHERAKKEIEAGRKFMDAAQKLESADVEAAKGKYVQAAGSFDKADALVDGIARSYRIEIARRRIDADGDAEKFDKAMSKLGKSNLSPQEYQNMILSLVRLLDNVRDNLQLVIAAAKPFPKELVLELKWAELDLKKMDGMRKILLDEFNGSK
jgi:hypothetical protein